MGFFIRGSSLWKDYTDLLERLYTCDMSSTLTQETDITF